MTLKQETELLRLSLLRLKQAINDMRKARERLHPVNINLIRKVQK